MKQLFDLLKSYSWKQWLVAALMAAAAAAASVLCTSCSTAAMAVSGDRNKVVQDSTHYEVVLEK